MQRSIEIDSQKISYFLKTKVSCRTISLSIKYDGKITVSAPKSASYKYIDNFIVSKSKWLLSKIAKFKEANLIKLPSTKQDYIKFKDMAYIIANERLNHFNQFYNFKWKNISIKNTKSRWGSCSKSGNLNFNYKIALLPPKMTDYIIVHELCHLGEFNHSKNFWNLVARTIPDYKTIRKNIKSNYL